MARTIGKLTALAVERTKRRGYYGDGGGLFLQVSARGSKSWVFRFKDKCKLRAMGLGPTHTVTLAEAREKARGCRNLRLEGVDPIEGRRAERAKARLAAAKAMTFEMCAERYMAAPKAGWRSPKSLAAWEGALGTYVYPVFGDLPVQAIDTALVMKGHRAGMGPEARDGQPCPRPNRKHPRLGDGARLAGRREPGPLARTP